MFRFPRILPQSILILTLVSMVFSPAGAQAQDQPAMPGPTKEHEILKKAVGTWDATSKMWSQPGAEPTVSKGTEKNELLAGGMWLVSRFEGDMDGMPFTGMGTFGYDPVEKKYIATWIDSMSPHMMTMKGDYDAATKTSTSFGESRAPETGEKITYKMISRSIDDDTRVFEMYMPGENGEYWKMMEIEYKRRAE